MDHRWLGVLACAVLLLPLPANGRALVGAMAQDPETSTQSLEEPSPPPALAIPPGYLYEPGGRRDPFVNPIPPPEVVGTVIPEVRPLGLPGVLLNEAQLIGVVTSPEPSMNVVVVLAPGNRTFFARSGDELFDAVIRDIRPDQIYFEVKPLEGQPEPGQREEVVRRLSATPGD